MAFRFAQLVGSYSLVVSAELLAFIERAFVAPAPAAEQAAIRGEALAEAAAAQLIIEANGTISSRAGAAEFYRIQVVAGEGQLEQLAFEKAPGHGVVLRMLDADTLVAAQAGKPDAFFRRLAP
jgi:hypothetical protein